MQSEGITLWQDVATSILSVWTLVLALSSWQLLRHAKAMERELARQARLKRWLESLRTREGANYRNHNN